MTLILEFKNTLPPEEFTLLEGRCLNYGGPMAYLPFLDILRLYFGIDEGVRENAIAKKIEDKLTELDEELLPITLSAFHDLLSLKIEDETWRQLEPKEKRNRTFEAIGYLLISASQKRPLVVAIEDLHWMDKTSEEFLNYFIDWLTHSPILLILLYRPEYNHHWSSRSPYTKIGLSQLTSQSSAELIRAILSRKNIAKACRLRAQVFLAEGRLEEALQELSTALEVAHRIGNPPQLWKTYTILGDLHQAQGRIEEAYRAYGDAPSIIEKVSKNLSNESLRDTFISSVFVQEIRQKARMADSKKET